MKGVNIARFSPDGRWVVSGGDDGTIKIWDLTAGKLLHDFQHHTGPIESLDFHPNEFLMASGSADGGVTFWDLETFERISNATYDSSKDGVRSVTFTPNGQSLLAAYRSCICAWSWEPATCSDTITADWQCESMDMSIVNDQLVACTSFNDQVGIWMVNLQKINLGPVARPSSHTLKLHGDTNGSRPDFQVNSARNVLKNGLSQFNSMDLPPMGDPLEDRVNISPERVPPEDTKVAIKPTAPKPSTKPKVQKPPTTYGIPVQPTVTPTPTPALNPTPSPAPTFSTPSVTPTLPKQDRPSLDIASFLPKSQAQQQETDMQEADVMSQLMEQHNNMTTILTTRYTNLKAIKASWNANGSGADSKGILAVLGVVSEFEDAALMVDFLRALPQREDFYTLDLCTALLPHLIELLNETKDDYLHLALSLTIKLVRLFGHIIKTTREAPSVKGVDISKEERLEKCQACYNYLVTIQHLVTPMARRSGTAGKNAKDLSAALKIYMPELWCFSLYFIKRNKYA